MAQPLTQAEINAILSSGIYPSQSQWQQISSSWRSTMVESSAPTGNITILYTDARSQAINPSVDITATMVKTSRRADASTFLLNKSLTKKITVLADDGSTICILIPNSYVRIVSKVSTPTVSTDWYTCEAGGGIASFTPTGSWTTNVTYTGLIQRLGPIARIFYKVVTSGSTDIVQLTFNIPFGLTVLESNIFSSPDGLTPLTSGGIFNSTQLLYSGGLTYDKDVDVIYAYKHQPSGFNLTFNGIDGGAPLAFGVGDGVCGVIDLPINGWQIGS